MPEDLLKLERTDPRRYEVVDGRLVEKERDIKSNVAAGKLIVKIGMYFEANRLPHFVMPDELYACFPHKPDRGRKPDVSVILFSSLAEGKLLDDPVRIRPDLAIEVISKSDKVWDVEEKLDDYERAGVPLVLVVLTHTRKARVFREGREVAVVTEDQALTLDPVLPGFSVPLRDILPPRIEEAART